mmetsp:Transcript_81322/g.136082  ORF Transcript_81322/g.136082 Transcript_81322/m.136082 type:complete len:97 (-) Transcript_81322:3469-3759(-)
MVRSDAAGCLLAEEQTAPIADALDRTIPVACIPHPFVERRGCKAVERVRVGHGSGTCLAKALQTAWRCPIATLRLASPTLWKGMWASSTSPPKSFA